MNGPPAYYWYYKARAKLWCIKHIIRPLLAKASKNGLIAGKRRV